jgi:transposase
VERTEITSDVEALQTLLIEKDQEIERLKEMLVLMKRKQFSSSSEKLPPIDQYGLFNEIEEEAQKSEQDEEDEDEKILVPAHSRSRGKRKPLPENLRREDVLIELPESERVCTNNPDHMMEKIGEETSEKLDIIPMQAKVIRTIRCKYSCKECQDGVKTAPVQPQAIPKGMASEGLLAAIATWKYVDHLPLYRIEAMFTRIGVEIPRGTQAHWMIKMGNLIQPLMNLLNDELLESSYIQMDETRVQVLKEKDKRAESQSYMWVRSRPGPDPIILFEYDPTRKGDVALSLLQGFTGKLQADGYDGYNLAEETLHLLRFGCMAHCRRKFHDAMKASKKVGIANKAVKYIQKLYRIEDECDGKTSEERFRIRQEKSKPLLEELKKWIDQSIPTVPPQGLVGKALSYAANEWVYLSRFVDHGEIEIDNNWVENWIRPFALGRKNWLFSDSVEGAKASAALYSLIVTAKANGLEPYRYLKHVFEKLPRAKTLEDIEALLPSKAKSTLQ